MLQFHANYFVQTLNLLNQLEGIFRQLSSLKNVDEVFDAYASHLTQLELIFGQINLPVSASHAERMKTVIKNRNPQSPTVTVKIITEYSEELRRRIADELGGRNFYYISDNVQLMSDSRAC